MTTNKMAKLFGFNIVRSPPTLVGGITIQFENIMKAREPIIEPIIQIWKEA